MDRTGDKKWRFLEISDGGLAGTPRRRADLECERALRALFVAMCNREGKAVNRNFHNIARGRISPWRVLMRKFREARAVRNRAHNYPLMKEAVRVLDQYVDELHGVEHLTGEHKPAA